MFSGIFITCLSGRDAASVRRTQQRVGNDAKDEKGGKQDWRYEPVLEAFHGYSWPPVRAALLMSWHLPRRLRCLPAHIYLRGLPRISWTLIQSACRELSCTSEAATMWVPRYAEARPIFFTTARSP